LITLQTGEAQKQENEERAFFGLERFDFSHEGQEALLK